MREFEYGGKINFVDQNDVYVGFDNQEYCCELFGWFFSRDLPDINEMQNHEWRPDDLEDYIFVKDFMHEMKYPDKFDGGGAVVFKLLNSKDEVLYLTLYNSHNGYYGHGFEVKDGVTLVKFGGL